jgi:hypothetical protein
VAAHVLPAWRRRGVGGALLDAVDSFVQPEATAISPWSKLAEDSEAASFCVAIGFTVHHRVLNFAAIAPELEIALAAYRSRLDRAGWIPPGASVVELAAAPAAEVAHLVAREFGSSPATMLARINGRGARPFEPVLSVVLLLDGAVAGAQMVSIADDGVAEVEANVVMPTLRRGWANLLLTHEGTRKSAAAGTQRFRFFCDERVIDTVNLARRCGAELIRTDLALIRPCA